MRLSTFCGLRRDQEQLCQILSNICRKFARGLPIASCHLPDGTEHFLELVLEGVRWPLRDINKRVAPLTSQEATFSQYF
jgi:hypothetical protein